MFPPGHDVFSLFVFRPPFHARLRGGPGRKRFRSPGRSGFLSFLDAPPVVPILSADRHGKTHLNEGTRHGTDMETQADRDTVRGEGRRARLARGGIHRRDRLGVHPCVLLVADNRDDGRSHPGVPSRDGDRTPVPRRALLRSVGNDAYVSPVPPLQHRRGDCGRHRIRPRIRTKRRKRNIHLTDGAQSRRRGGENRSASRDVKKRDTSSHMLNNQRIFLIFQTCSRTEALSPGSTLRVKSASSQRKRTFPGNRHG